MTSSSIFMLLRKRSIFWRKHHFKSLCGLRRMRISGRHDDAIAFLRQSGCSVAAGFRCAVRYLHGYVETGRVSYRILRSDDCGFSYVFTARYTLLYYALKKSFMSSSTEVMPAMPKLFTNTLATLGERNAGNVGPRWMSFTPSESRASNTMTAFCSYQAML